MLSVISMIFYCVERLLYVLLFYSFFSYRAIDILSVFRIFPKLLYLCFTWYLVSGTVVLGRRAWTLNQMQLKPSSHESIVENLQHSDRQTTSTVAVNLLLLPAQSCRCYFANLHARGSEIHLEVYRGYCLTALPVECYSLSSTPKTLCRIRNTAGDANARGIRLRHQRTTEKPLEGGERGSFSEHLEKRHGTTPDAALRKAASDKQMEHLKKHHICDLVPPTAQQSLLIYREDALGPRWVYRIKADKTFKEILLSKTGSKSEE